MSLFKEFAWQETAVPTEFKSYRDITPEGREVWVGGDPRGCEQFNHLQGDNTFGYKGTCGLVSCEDILNQFGQRVTEDEIVAYARKNDLCEHSRWLELTAPDMCGGTTPEWQAQILRDYGVPARVEYHGSLAQLADDVAQNRGVIIEANAGVLWDEPNAYDDGAANHAVVVTGVARDVDTQAIVGFYINDSAPPASGRLVSVETLQEAWLQARGPYGGGCCVVTETGRPA